MYVDINAAGCSNICRHCSTDGLLPFGGFYSLDELRAIKNEWGALTIRYEPTAHPDFPEIYNPDIAVEHGGWLVTNGFGLAHRGDYRLIFEKMLSMEIKAIAFTLHGLREHHNWFVGKLGAFDDILLATKRAKEFGFSVIWQVFVDKAGIGDLSELIELSVNMIGDLPSLTIPYHRVGGRLWHYEKLRLTLGDVEKYRLSQLIDNPKKNIFINPERLTASSWLYQWANNPSASDEFKHPYEPRTWVLDVTYPMLSIRIDRNRKVYLDPMCNSPIFLGEIAEGKGAIIEKLERLSMPLFANLSPDEVKLSFDEQEQLHPSGFSLRYKEIAKKRFRKNAAHR
jgi:MoaA/NifB/PqqE/SkfB family radical SAM enzyme